MRLLAATVTLLSLASCAPKPHPTAHSGPPPSEPPQVLGVQTWPSLPERTTTTTQPVVPATAAPPVTAHVHEVEPLAASEPVRQSDGRLGDPYYEPTWYTLAECESHGEWDYGPHSTWGSRMYEGGLQFAPSTWDGFKPAGYPEAAYQASPSQQILVAQRVWEAQGWEAWPSCSRSLGWR